jgi:hypothetical protein
MGKISEAYDMGTCSGDDQELLDAGKFLKSLKFI